MAEQVTIIIDGKECLCEKGEYVFDVARRNGIEIPGYCRHDAIEDHRACCRLCMVEVEKRGRTQLVASCVYPVDGPFTVTTSTPRIEENRTILRALIKEPEIAQFKRFEDIENDKCILCGLCAQACDSMGTGAISLVNRGVNKEIDTPYNKPALTCIGCLSCVHVCPKDAIPYSEDESTRTIWHKDFELAKCEKCGAVIGTKESVAYAWENTSAPVEDSFLCEACRRKLSANIIKGAFRMD